MRRLFLIITATFITATTFAQMKSANAVTNKNSWLKLGIDVGVPTADASKTSNFVLGVDFKAQLMETEHIGVGVATGYNQFFAKDNFSSFGAIPLGAFMRYYPESMGFFAGLDLGYSFFTSSGSSSGGFYAKPQVGYHNYDWNIYGFYNNIFLDGSNISHAGIGASYNIRFK